MDVSHLFKLLDARPFRPFDVALVNGERVRVDHPENVHIFPGRERAKVILIYYPEPDDYSMVYPEGITAYHVRTAGNGKKAHRRQRR